MAQAWSERAGRPGRHLGWVQMPQGLKEAHDLLAVRLTGRPDLLCSPRAQWATHKARLPDPQPHVRRQPIEKTSGVGSSHSEKRLLGEY